MLTVLTAESERRWQHRGAKEAHAYRSQYEPVAVRARNRAGGRRHRARLRPTQTQPMSNAPARRLSGEDILALKFAAHRQLARWAKKPRLSPRQHAQRDALKRVVVVLQDQAFEHGCELRRPNDGGER
jgi:hypothetical protein